MINPNALPTSPTVQDFQNLESALDSSDYNDTLQAMQYIVSSDPNILMAAIYPLTGLRPIEIVKIGRFTSTLN